MLEPMGLPPRDGDRLGFAREPAAAVPDSAPWKVLIVDDEEEVHTLTRLVLRNYTFEDRPLQLISAYSGIAAYRVMQQEPDIALVLLDVVMEREDSGLRLIRRIRQEMGNKNVRIILRTGQPGQAPELEVVAQYDINDYKAKVDLTAQKLFTTVTSALRSWRDIQTIEQSRQGLRRVLDASRVLFASRTGHGFAAGVLDELLGLTAAAVGETSTGGLAGVAARPRSDEAVVVAGRGALAATVGSPLRELLATRESRAVERILDGETCHFYDHGFAAGIRDEASPGLLFLVRSAVPLKRIDRGLVEIFLSNASLSYHNANLSREIIDTQKEIIHTLGEVVETRSKETANHVLRVGKMAHRLGELAGLADEETAILRLAAPMHDVGKVGISDTVLNKPGPLTDEEYRLMQSHTLIGHEILAKSERRIMRSAAQVALEHHERWDGRGYPHGLAGERIGLFSRITALVDVFDAVANRRIYRPARPIAEVVALLESERGRHFDPRLVDVFLAHLDDFVAVIAAHPDLEAGREDASAMESDPDRSAIEAEARG